MARPSKSRAEAKPAKPLPASTPETKIAAPGPAMGRSADSAASASPAPPTAAGKKSKVRGRSRLQPEFPRDLLENGEELAAPAEKTVSKPPPIVAVGASAGGLDAFNQLLSALPEDTGMAYVLIQHLYPAKLSMLPDLLRRRSKMPVIEIQPNTEPLANHIYVLGANWFVTLKGGRLRLSKREKSPVAYLPIDAFMSSLAEERESGAIGVVLSGTASDGTLGLTEIKNNGGITFAQSEETAEFDTMPRSAIAAGCVDFVLSPGEIAHELARIGRHPYVSHYHSPGSPTLSEDPVLKPVLDLLLRDTGVDFSRYRSSTIRRRIARRLALHPFERISDYIRLLREKPEEVNRLYEDLLIPTTRFFRDPESFEALARQVYPRLTQNRPEGLPIRVWSVGCSTGEETYSLAIHWQEYLHGAGLNFPLQVFGTDLSQNSIARARTGQYSAEVMRDISPERLRRFFTQDEGGYRVNKTIRDRCIFAQHNLLREPPFARLDLIFCRNVMIYMEPSLQRRILPILHYALNANGCLVLGTSENASLLPLLYAPLDRKWKIFSKLPASHVPIPEFGSPRRESGKGSFPHPPKRALSGYDAQQDALREANQVVLDVYSPPGVVVDANLEVIQFRGHTAPFIEPASGAASLNLLKMTRGELGAFIHALIQQVKSTNQPARRAELHLETNQGQIRFNLEVVPINSRHPKEPLFLVLFQSLDREPPQAKVQKKKPVSGQNEIERLRQALANSQQTVRTLIEEAESSREEYQAANEEIASANEELQSTNEEIETSKEELQSANEELNTVNEELSHRNADLHQANDDLNNLIATVGIPIVMLDRELRIRRVTTAAQQVFRLIAADIGRRLTDLRLTIHAPELEAWAARVIAGGESHELEVQDAGGHWYLLRLYPYRTADSRIEGVVLALLDIHLLKHDRDRQQETRVLIASITAAVREPLVVLDQEFKVLTANPAFARLFAVKPETILGTPLWRIGGRWNISRLREALQQALRHEAVMSDFTIEHELSELGRRELTLNIGRLIPYPGAGPLLLVAFEDVTEREQAMGTLKANERLHAASRFASILAHEINNPLQALTQALYLLRETVQPLAGAHAAVAQSLNYLNMADSELQRLTRISQELLQAGNLGSAPGEFRAAELIERAYSLFASRLAAKRVRVERRFADGLASWGVADEIMQAMINIFFTELEALPEAGQLVLRISPSRDWHDLKRRGVRILIADSAPALTPAQHRAAFGPDPMLTPDASSSLHLWLSRQLIEKNLGRLRLRSCAHSGRFYSIFLPEKESRSPRRS